MEAREASHHPCNPERDLLQRPAPDDASVTFFGAGGAFISEGGLMSRCQPGAFSLKKPSDAYIFIPSVSLLT